MENTLSLTSLKHISNHFGGCGKEGGHLGGLSKAMHWQCGTSSTGYLEPISLFHSARSLFTTSCCSWHTAQPASPLNNTEMAPTKVRIQIISHRLTVVRTKSEHLSVASVWAMRIILEYLQEKNKAKLWDTESCTLEETEITLCSLTRLKRQHWWHYKNKKRCSMMLPVMRYILHISVSNNPLSSCEK